MSPDDKDDDKEFEPEETVTEVLDRFETLKEEYSEEFAKKEITRELVQKFDLKELVRAKASVFDKEKLSLLDKVLEAKREEVEIERVETEKRLRKLKEQELKALEETRERRGIWDEKYLSDAQIRKINKPAKKYAKDAWKNGVWNRDWGDPRDYDIKIHPRPIRNTTGVNTDFVYMVTQVLGLPFSGKWGKPEDFAFIE